MRRASFENPFDRHRPALRRNAAWCGDWVGGEAETNGQGEGLFQYREGIMALESDALEAFLFYPTIERMPDVQKPLHISTEQTRGQEVPFCPMLSKFSINGALKRSVWSDTLSPHESPERSPIIGSN